KATSSHAKSDCGAFSVTLCSLRGAGSRRASISRKIARTPEIPKVMARTMRISARIRCGEFEAVMRVGNLKDVAKKPSKAAGHRLTGLSLLEHRWAPA